MKKLTTVALAGAFAISSFASASATRWTGFGDASLFVGDVQDTFTLPQTAASNPDALYMEFGPQYHYDAVADEWNNPTPGTPADDSIDGSGWGGANLTLGPGVLSIWGNRPYTAGSNLEFHDGFPTFNFGPGGTADAYLTPGNTVDILYAMNISDKLTVGLGINRSSGSHTWDDQQGTDDFKHNTTANDFGVSVGADIKQLGPIDCLQIGVQWNGGGSTSEYTETGNPDARTVYTQSDINVRVGADVKGDKGKFQRYEAGINLQNGDAKASTNVSLPPNIWLESKASAIAYDLGWAYGMSSEKGMGLCGLVLNGSAWDNTNDQEESDFGVDSHDNYNWSQYSVEFVSAGETKLTSWLTGRAGIATTLLYGRHYKADYKDGGNTEIQNADNDGNENAGTKLTLGLSLNIGEITIDGALNQDLLYNGLYITNGIATPLFSQVSATWAWGAGKE